MISDKPWDGSASRFTDAQWRASCIVHLDDSLDKNAHKLPIREPDGALSRAAVHAAAARINQVDAPADKIATAKRALRGAYDDLGETAPDSIRSDSDLEGGPMGLTISRAFASDLEVRSAGDGRTIHGIVVPFDRIARVSDGGPAYEEAFQRGAFAKTIAERGDKVKLLLHHNARSNPLGRATLLREEHMGVYGEFRVSQTNAGDEALELVRDGAFDSFSVGFSPIKHEKRSGVTWRTEVALREASLVTFPAYPGALVGGVRAADLTPEDLAEIARMLRENGDAATPLGEPAGVGTSPEAARVVEPPSGTPDVSKSFRSLRLKAREKGVL